MERQIGDIIDFALDLKIPPTDKVERITARAFSQAKPGEFSDSVLAFATDDGETHYISVHTEGLPPGVLVIDATIETENGLHGTYRLRTDVRLFEPINR